MRDVAPGHLGIFVFWGPPGAGKDFLADLPPKVWRATSAGSARASFDLSVTDDLEQKRMLFSSGGAIYARAKEVGKRRGASELLIRLAGTDKAPARGMRRDEIEVPLNFAILADAAEGLPERREISRRTVVIEVTFMEDSISKGEVLGEILARAPDIVASLKRQVESKPPEWFLNQAETKSRPLIPVALSRMFDAELGEVRGRGLEELFEAMLAYKEHGLCGEEGEREQAKMRPNDGTAATTFPSFRLSHFIDTMGAQAGFRALAREFKTARAVQLWLLRETDYTQC